VIGIAHQHRALDKAPLIPTCGNIRKRRLAIADGAKLHHGRRRAGLRQALEGLDDGAPRDGPQALDRLLSVRAAAAAELLGQGPPARPLERRERDGVGHAAHGHEAGGDGVGAPGVAVVVDRGAARAVAREHDALRVAAEAGNVVADPLDGEPLVEQAQVVFGQEGSAGEAEDVEAVAGWVVRSLILRSVWSLLDAHDYQIVLGGKSRAIHVKRIACARPKSAAVDPDKHSLGLLASLRLRPDIQSQTVLAVRVVSPASHCQAVRRRSVVGRDFAERHFAGFRARLQTVVDLEDQFSTKLC
jgi:hypothetical protein